MAANLKRKSRYHNCVSTISLEGCITSSVRFKLVTEFLKDILYQRQQIPMPHHQILNCIQADQQKQEDGLSGSKTRIKLRKQRQYVQHMSEVIETLEQVFSIATTVRRVLIMMGSSIVSPKELYMIQFPTSLYNGKILSLNHCKAQLFRQILASPFFVDATQPHSCVKVHILVEIPNDCIHDICIIPKPAFKLPSKGNSLTLQFVYPSYEPAEEMSRLNDTEFDISGIEPLNTTLPDVEMSTQKPSVHGTVISQHKLDDLKHSTPCHHFKLNGYMQNSYCSTEPPSDSTSYRCASPMEVVTTSLAESTDNTCDSQGAYMWYQLPTSIQGYKERTSSC